MKNDAFNTFVWRYPAVIIAIFHTIHLQFLTNGLLHKYSSMKLAWSSSPDVLRFSMNLFPRNLINQLRRMFSIRRLYHCAKYSSFWRKKLTTIFCIRIIFLIHKLLPLLSQSIQNKKIYHASHFPLNSNEQGHTDLFKLYFLKVMWRQKFVRFCLQCEWNPFD